MGNVPRWGSGWSELLKLFSSTLAESAFWKVTIYCLCFVYRPCLVLKMFWNQFIWKPISFNKSIIVLGYYYYAWFSSLTLNLTPFSLSSPLYVNHLSNHLPLGSTMTPDLFSMPWAMPKVLVMRRSDTNLQLRYTTRGPVLTISFTACYVFMDEIHCRVIIFLHTRDQKAS